MNSDSTTTRRTGVGTTNWHELTAEIKLWAADLGFQRIGISNTDLRCAESELLAWLARGFEGDMDYMRRHGTRRTRAFELLPDTIRIISVGLDYWPQAQDPRQVLSEPGRAYVSRYALGRDYHKMIRKRLTTLARKIAEQIGPFGYRAFADSAPVMEKPLAKKAGLGWIGKHTNLIDKSGGSWFFLGELYTTLPLPEDTVAANHCGRCRVCIDACPTRAIIAPYQLDARLCISYLTIEHRGAIPESLRPAMGNRIFGCDDCQLVCPWNRFAKTTLEKDFQPRHGLDAPRLVELFAWNKQRFDDLTRGSAIRRLGHERWLRNIAVALGNATRNDRVVSALTARSNHESLIVREHVAWALRQHRRTG